MPVSTVNLYGTGPDANIDQSQILRAQQLAQLLQQQANAPIESPAPNAPISWTQGLNKLAEGLAVRKQNQKVTALQKDAVAKQQALIQSLFPQQPMAATPLGEALAPGAGVMQNSATPGAQRPGLPSLTGSREADMALASQPGGLPAYLQSVAAQKEKEREEANKVTVVPEGAGLMRGGNVVAPGTPKPHPINWELTGGEKVPLDTMTGQRVPGLDPLKMTPTPGQDLTNSKGTLTDSQNALLGALIDNGGITALGAAGIRGQNRQSALQSLLDRHQGKTPDEIASGVKNGSISFGADKAATTQSLAANEKLYTAVSGYANTLDKNLDQLLAAYKKIDSSGSPLINRALRSWQQGVAGDPDTAAMTLWLKTVQTEFAKLQSGAMGNAPVSDAAMREAGDLINKYMNEGGIEAVAAAMRQEKVNRLSSIKAESERLRGAFPAPGSAPAAASSGVPTGIDPKLWEHMTPEERKLWQ